MSKYRVDEFINNVFEATEILLENPFFGQKEDFLASLNKNHRHIILGNYKIIYRVEEDKIIYINEIFDSR